MKIRKLQYDDLSIHLDEILCLLNDSYMSSFQISHEKCESITKEEIKQLGSYIKQGNATVLGAFENESLVGFLWLYKHDFYGEPRVHINHIAVSKQFRGKGIGKRLIQEAESLAKYDGIGAIDLFVSEINVRAMNVYDAIGFKTERRYMSKKLL